MNMMKMLNYKFIIKLSKVFTYSVNLLKLSNLLNFESFVIKIFLKKKNKAGCPTDHTYKGQIRLFSPC